MNVDNGALEFEAYLSNERLNSTALEAERRIKGLTSTVEGESQKMDQAFSNIGKYVAGYFGIQAMTGFVTQLTKVRGEFQQLDVAFTTMLGSKEKSDTLMAQLLSTAAKTPFTLQEVAGGAKQLLAYQVAAEDVNDTVIRLGNIASGVSVPLDRLILAYGQVKAKGKLQGDDMRQFTEAGIPIIHELAKVMGVADTAISKMVEEGKIGFPQVQQVMQNLTNEGGMFYNLMEKQSKTLTGQISNLEDAWSRMLNSIGESNEGVLSGAISGATYLVDHYQEVLDILIPIVATYGAYRAALIATAVAQRAVAAATFIQEYVAMGSALGFATANQIAFNRSVLANPYALAAAAVVGLTIVIYQLIGANKELSEIEKSKQNIKEKAGQQYEEEKAKITSLIGVINNEKVALDQRQKALKDIQAIIPSYHASLTNEGKLINNNKEAIDSYLKSLEKQIYLQTTLDEKIELTKKKRQLEKDVAKKEQSAKDAEAAANAQTQGPNSFGSSGSVSSGLAIQARGFVNKAKKELEAVKDAIKALDDEYAKISTSGNEASDAIANVIVKNKAFWEEQKKNNTNARDNLADTEKGSKAWMEYTRLIKEAEMHLAAYNDKAGSKAAKEENDALAKFNEEKVKAQKKYDEMLLASQKAQVDDKKKLIDLDLQNTVSGINEMEKIYKEKAQKAGIKKPDVSIFGKMRDVATSQATFDKSEVDREKLDKLVKDYQTYKEKINSLEKAYDDDLLFLTKSYYDAKSDIEKNKIKAAIEQRQKTFSDEVKKIQSDFLNENGKGLVDLYFVGNGTDFIKAKIKESMPLFEDITRLTYTELEKVRGIIDKIEFTPEQIESFKQAGIDVEKLNEALKKVKKSSTEAVDAAEWEKVLATANKLSGSLGSLGSSLEKMGGDVGEIGKGLSGISSQIGNISTAFSSTASTGDKISAGISGLASLVGMVADQIEANKRFQEEWNQKIIDGAHNLSLMRIEAEKYKQANIFGVENPYSKAIAGAKEYAVATNELSDATLALNNGQVQTGTKKVVSGANIAKGAGAGAAAGAAIGSVIPVVGTLIGAGVGAIIGAGVGALSTKTVAVMDNLKHKYGDIVDENGDLNKKMLADYSKMDDATKKLIDNWKDLKAKQEEAQAQMKQNFTDLAGDLGASLSDSLVEAFSNGNVYGAIDKFDAKLNDVVDGIVAKLIFSAVFGEMFNALEKRMQESFSAGGDQSITDDIKVFKDEYKQGLNEYNQAMKEANDELKSEGFAGFQPGSKSSNSLSGAIQSTVTEETATVLSGYINNIRINQANSLAKMDGVLMKLDNIAGNTAYLINIDRNISKLTNDNMRSLG
jgi:tape measure domain-containing protein